MEATIKLSSELNAINMRYEELFKAYQVLDESIVSYLINNEAELLSYRKFFDTRIEKGISALKGIEQGIAALIELEKGE